MLGYLDKPHLLVEITSWVSPKSFTFNVINGGWLGSFNNGSIKVDATGDVISNVTILVTDQKRLGGNYQDVFYNIHNPDYSFHQISSVYNELDDDIPF